MADYAKASTAPANLNSTINDFGELTPTQLAAREQIDKYLSTEMDYSDWYDVEDEDADWERLLQAKDHEHMPEHHAKYLRDRGVLPKYVKYHVDVWSIPNTIGLLLHYDFEWSQKQTVFFRSGVPALMFSFVNRLGPKGEVEGAIQVRADKPRGDTDAKTGKYRTMKFELPTGHPDGDKITRKYDDHHLMAWTGQLFTHDDGPDVPIIITEGIAKGMAIESDFIRSGREGLATIALAGVHNGFHKETPKEPQRLTEDLEAIPWAGRPVIIAFDADWTTNASVRGAIETMGRLLEARGANVFVVLLDQNALGLGDEKAGIDDAIVHLRRQGDKAPMWTLTRDLLSLAQMREATAFYAPDDIGRGLHLARRLDAAGFRYVPGGKEKWAEYNREKGIWSRTAMAKEHVKARTQEVSRDPRAAELWRGATSARGVAAAIEMSTTKLLTDEDEFDKNSLHIVARNGVVNLETGGLVPHHPSWLATISANAAYDPEAGPDADNRWSNLVLDTMSGDAEMARFLQVYLGTGLIGLPLERLAIFVGTGANGKGVLLNTLQEVFGEYTTTLYSDALTGKLDPRMIAHIRNRRLVVMQETRAGERLDDGAVKTLASADRVVGAKVYEEHSSFAPTHTGVLATNDIPRIAASQGGAAGHGLFRRLLVVEFLRTVPPEERDERLVSTLVADHADEVLTWAINGALMYLQDGLEKYIPEAVKAATQRLREDSDTVGRFIRDCLLVDPVKPDLRADRAAVYNAYAAWCMDEHTTAMTRQSFYKALTERGVPADLESLVKSGEKRWIVGVGLLKEAPARIY